MRWPRTPGLAAALLLAGLMCAATPSLAEGPIRSLLRGVFGKDDAAPATAQDVKARIDKPGDYTFSIEHDGLTRMYMVHVPPKYSAATPTPLLLSFHGGGGHMAYQASEPHYGQISKSDREGFVVVFPNGYSKFKSGKLATWNAGTCCGPARDQKVDDVGFVRQMLANLGAQLNIDRGRIFATGMSNGGMFAHRLACEMPDTFKAVASVAGPDGTSSCTPSQPISVLHIHARNDDHAVFEGGSGKKSMAKSTITDFVSVPETVARWVKRDGCNTTPQRVLDKPGAYCERYSQCKGKVEVELCVTETGGHSWPGAEKVRGDAPASNAISANDVMWDFFMSR